MFNVKDLDEILNAIPVTSIKKLPTRESDSEGTTTLVQGPQTLPSCEGSSPRRDGGGGGEPRRGAAGPPDRGDH